MLNKCSNPSCFHSFLRLKEGNLFRLESESQLSVAEPSRVEYFWLCDTCSQAMTLRLGENGTVVETVLPALNLSVDRREGWLLRNMSEPTEYPAEYSRLRTPSALYGS